MYTYIVYKKKEKGKLWKKKKYMKNASVHAFTYDRHICKHLSRALCR